jgi:hypothetical protein
MHIKLWSENLKGRDHSLRRPRHRWEDKMRMDLREIEWEGVHRIFLNQDGGLWHTPVNMVPEKMGNFLTS